MSQLELSVMQKIFLCQNKFLALALWRARSVAEGAVLPEQNGERRNGAVAEPVT